MPLLESMLLSLLLKQSKLDLPTLRQCSRERKNATYIYIYIHIYICTYIYIYIYIYIIVLFKIFRF